jgi:hypothetical protein
MLLEVHDVALAAQRFELAMRRKITGLNVELFSAIA